MHRWLALLLGLWIAHGQAGTARLADATPLPGVWWNPDHPGTALLWDQSPPSELGASAVLEYDAQGGPIWLDYRTLPLVWRDSTTLRPDRGYALALGELGRVEAEGFQVQARHLVGAAQLEFVDNRHAIWTRNGERAHLQHFAMDAHPGIDPRRTDDLLLFARGPVTQGRTSAALVRLQPVADGQWALTCLDCTSVATSAPLSRRLPAQAVQSLQLHRSSGDRGELRFVTDGDVDAWLHLPYRDRTHALSTRSDALLEEVHLLPVGAGFHWQEGDVNRLTMPQYPITEFSRVEGRDGVGRSDRGLRRFAYFDRSVLVTLHDPLQAPRWYLDFPLDTPACGRGRCLGMQFGRGQLGQPTQLYDFQPANIAVRYISEVTGETLRLQRQPLFALPDMDSEYLYTPEPPVRLPEHATGWIVVRTGGAELRALVQWSGKQIARDARRFELQCIECDQTGIAGDVARANAAMQAFVSRFTIHQSLSQLVDSGIYRAAMNDVSHSYWPIRGHRNLDLHWVWSSATRGADGQYLLPSDPAVPMWIHFFPLRE